MAKRTYVHNNGKSKQRTLHDYSIVQIGYKRNLLTLLERNIYVNYKEWCRFKCDCGNETSCTIFNFFKDKVKSCGCLKHGQYGNTHSKSKTRLYRIYNGIKFRCLNSNSNNYMSYGGRGIKICDEWKNDFMSFYKWSNNNGYQDGLTIDRIDVNGNYEPYNCRWTDAKTQSRNKRNTKLIDGKTYGEILETLYPNYSIKIMAKFKSRIKYGFSVDEALEDLEAKRPANKGYDRGKK